ncbi:MULTISPECIES: hypothetical protein [Enterobacter]|uniref:hypothetical protein n=1 Tax=Enterobacter TaxID=547 RepID=UPI001B17ACC1|nr:MULTISPECIES: hypothetical protein [Enterobacter]EHR8826113.1 hypothetical protein [Escherichia coli]HDT6029531.1 hypothetical protein [Enterobacter cloacae subsp. cloacae]EJD0151979.1 hypothetical protein [Escherichia coli]EMB6149906.1 hypothetical protein [Enterobacter asburiae]MBS7444276.1 hypothetical protein [Enterobacter sp. 120016]
MKVPGDSVSERDIRRCHFYIRHMADNKIPVHSFDYNPDEVCESINQSLRNHLASSVERARFIENMKIKCDYSLVRIEDFKWLDVDERAAYWFWSFFLSPREMTVHMPSASSSSNVPDISFPYPVTPPGSILPLSINTSHKSRVDSIVQYFDQWKLDRHVDAQLFSQGFSPAKMKSQIIIQLKSRWSEIYSEKDPFGFIKDRSDENMSWAWRYIKNYPHPLFDHKSLAPASKKETELALYCVWDTAPDDGIAKKYFMSEFKKAWSQKKFRDSSKDTRVLNTRLPKDVKEKLDFMSRKYNKSIADMVSYLIEGAYRSQSKDK